MSPLEQNRFMNQTGMYNKIQDRLMYLGNNAVLSIVIMLYSEHEKYGRRYYYKETKYLSNKTNMPTKKMSREFDSFLVLENLKPVGNVKEFITIRGKDLELMRMFLLPKLEYIIQNFDSIYEMRDGKMYVTDNIQPFEIDVGASKSLLFVPGIRKMYSEELQPCIDMYFNGNTANMVYLSYAQVYEFMYLIRTFQIHQYAATMLNYLGRPPAGTNLYDVTESQEYDNVVEMEKVMQGRTIGGKFANQSYFDKKSEEKDDE